MAAQNPVETGVSGQLNKHVVSIAWGPFVAGDTFTSDGNIAGAADRSVQVEGVFGGATVLIQGSNDNTNFETLRDPLGNNLSFTAAGLKQILEITQYIRPSHSGGGGTESLTVTVLAKRN